MALGETPLTIVGNLTSDPELKFTPAGAALAKFTIASTPRAYDRESGQYKDGTAMFMRCSAWRQMAEHIAESLTKGTRVVASGRLRQFDWTTDQGETRSMLALEVDEIGPSLRFATAAVTKTTRNATGGGTGAGAPDPWSAAPAGDKPPF
ncbi:single-stranded DNA-binding protein [Streptomyces sp. AJS327]|uniref:single-stranded DNA-binding protein n=1 Tax=Streptomyces sp. AJS327 TaxID=2545265 RepID=UPI0015DE25B3|nr:single-stranded DNA-binding protein [Streptomyces sp. AJS327]MBA0054033.1 single-stranded DNA-binding protein [Streptomyces sp. AJS327]